MAHRRAMDQTRCASGCGVSRTTLTVLLLATCSVAGCATGGAPSAASATNTTPSAITTNTPNRTDNTGLRERLDQAETAAIACVLLQASRLAGRPENPDQIALAAMVACGRQEQALRDVAELAYGRERSLAHMHIIQEQTRKGVVGLVASLRSRARQQESTKPSTRRGTDI